MYARGLGGGPLSRDLNIFVDCFFILGQHAPLRKYAPHSLHVGDLPQSSSCVCARVCVCVRGAGIVRLVFVITRQSGQSLFCATVPRFFPIPQPVLSLSTLPITFGL